MTIAATNLTTSTTTNLTNTSNFVLSSIPLFGSLIGRNWMATREWSLRSIPSYTFLQKWRNTHSFTIYLDGGREGG